MYYISKERRERLQPQRVQHVLNGLRELGIKPYEVGKSSIKFYLNDESIVIFPYTGWFSGKGINDGRGWMNLRNQIIVNLKDQ